MDVLSIFSAYYRTDTLKKRNAHKKMHLSQPTSPSISAGGFFPCHFCNAGAVKDGVHTHLLYSSPDSPRLYYS